MTSRLAIAVAGWGAAAALICVAVVGCGTLPDTEFLSDRYRTQASRFQDAWGPLSGLHINPAVTAAFTARGVFPARWVLPYWAVQFAGAIGAALFLQAMYTHVSAGGNYPIATPGGEWRSLVMETLLTAILVTIILMVV